ncbi:ATP-binding protein [Paracrocinitomix mangrovi]|uniref:ATP-binding protein n=1 Tax=Paracrocinitomix mangrovi TaxID=2862509 RepID=UPI001C8E6D67|nr:ATP-binding protein [Paracrocinitomix mangrovi]UKN02239.1 ATP-binding protein [Paracrocinitomix mangrovi]
MAKIPFTVSARTARLIGQENFSNVEGAIIELVKNCYDADATVALVIFDVIYEGIPNELDSESYEKLLSENSILEKSYTAQEDIYVLNKLKKPLAEELSSFFSKKNSLYIIDNGEGMTDTTILQKWMKIGTDNKLVDFRSNDGRIKTGAKGLGRFALDRLGEISNLKTLPKEHKTGYDWSMNWLQFEEQDKTLTDINADLDEIPHLDFEKEILNTFPDIDEIADVVKNPDYDFSKGTIIKISNLRDEWDITSLQKLFKSLEALIPPKELGVFNIFQFLLQNPQDFGEVSGHYFNNFEYKVEAKYIADELKIELVIHRNELDVERLEKEFSDVFKLIDSPDPYNLASLKKEQFKITKDITKVLKWRKEDSEKLLKSVGDFDFNFYFTKIGKPSADDFKSYPYLDNDYPTITKSFDKFGGIKIYRDYFRVRPYGEPGDDWLDLGKRQASSPASAGQRIGDWRVRAKQIAGVIDISRISNPELRDKSDRSSLIENTAFETFKKIVVGIISEFEYDRSRILHPFYLKRKKETEKRKKEELRKQAEELAQEIIAEKERNTDNKNPKSNVDSENSLQDTADIIEKKLTEQSEEKENSEEKEESEKDVELRLMRSLASLGLIVASFDHELKSISNNLEPRLRYLEKHLKTIIPKEKVAQLPDNKNPFKLISHIKVDHEKLKGWIDYSLSSIKTDKRKRKNLNFGKYFEQFKKNWKFVLQERNVELVLSGNSSKGNTIRAFEIDMDSIFNNLLTNSLEAFKLRREKYQRKIEITWSSSASSVEIFYSDNGIGLSEVFVDPDEIFEPFVTTKRDKRGNVIGTGLGMYVVKNVVEDYNGDVAINLPNQGFGVVLTFNKRKTDG